jgi:hypothetical protein
MIESPATQPTGEQEQDLQERLQDVNRILARGVRRYLLLRVLDSGGFGLLQSGTEADIENVVNEFDRAKTKGVL